MTEVASSEKRLSRPSALHSRPPDPYDAHLVPGNLLQPRQQLRAQLIAGWLSYTNMIAGLGPRAGAFTLVTRRQSIDEIPWRSRLRHIVAP